MRKTLTTSALILCVRPSGEKDRRIEFISPETGKIFAMAKGAKNMGSPFIGRLQPFNICTLMLYKSGAKKWTIVEAVLEKKFAKLEKNLEKMLAALKIIEALQTTMRETESLYTEQLQEKIFELTIKSLEEVEKNKKPHLIFEIFRIKFLDYLGLMPQITHCEKCFRKIEYREKIPWSTKGIVCEKCEYPEKENSKFHHDKYRKLISFLQTRPVSAINRIQWHNEDENIFNRISMEYWEIAGNQKLQTEKIIL